jgi:hypothetical protein
MARAKNMVLHLESKTQFHIAMTTPVPHFETQKTAVPHFENKPGSTFRHKTSSTLRDQGKQLRTEKNPVPHFQKGKCGTPQIEMWSQKMRMSRASAFRISKSGFQV